MAPPSFAPRTIHCSSKYANSNPDGVMTKCTFQLSRPITVPQEYELHISVLSACIPFSFYAIPATTITFIVNGANRAVIVPAGNWSGTDLAAKFTIAGLTCTFIQQTGLFNFTAGPNACTIPQSSLLGFSVATAVAANSTVASTFLPDFAGTRFINILSSLNTDCITSGTTTGGSGVLISLPINATPFNYIVFQPQNLVRNKLKESYVSNFDITICDSNMAPLNMNGASWELDLLIEVLIPNDQPYNESPVGDLFNAVAMYNPRRIKN